MSLWNEIEYAVQKQSAFKDRNFVLSGHWKQYAFNKGKFVVYLVNGRWIRTNLCCYFGHGGHGLVHEFIPMNEIWLSTHHYNKCKYEAENCGCQLDKPNQKASISFLLSTMEHEIEEFRIMKKGIPFTKAHKAALAKEIELDYLSSPYDDRSCTRKTKYKPNRSR